MIVRPHHHLRAQCHHSLCCPNLILFWFTWKSSFCPLNLLVRAKPLRLLFLHWIPFKNWWLMVISAMKILRYVKVISRFNLPRKVLKSKTEKFSVIWHFSVSHTNKGRGFYSKIILWTYALWCILPKMFHSRMVKIDQI